MISIVDYGLGNIQAFLNIFNKLGIKAQRASNVLQLKEASHLILPGVGHFDHAMKKLNDSDSFWSNFLSYYNLYFLLLILF